ncbi:MAG: hypothetical protein JRG91_10790 [Deltaproteobacteria bacterium]|nr:hypothetical protein [Deltaproteobacteria bacterium]
MRDAVFGACLAVALVCAPAAQARWAGGMILLPCKGASVDGAPASGGVLAAGQTVASGDHEARVFMRGAAGRALVVLAPRTSMTLAGSPTDGVDLALESGAVRVVMKSSGKSPVVSVLHGAERLELGEAGGVAEVTQKGGALVHALGSAEALGLFAQGASAAASSLPMPPSGLPLVSAGAKTGGGDGGQEIGGGAEVEGESQCLDSTSTGPEGADPTTDGTDPTEIDRTHTRVRIIVTW